MTFRWWFFRGFEAITSAINTTRPSDVHMTRRPGMRHGYWYGFPVYWRIAFWGCGRWAEIVKVEHDSAKAEAQER